MLFKKLKISFYTCCLSLALMMTPLYAIDVLIGGESVGIILNYDGICITGFYKIQVGQDLIDPSQYFEINDLITHVENQKVKTIDDLTTVIKKSKNDTIEFTIDRNEKVFNKKMKIYKNNSEFSTGLYVKDCAKGIGTVTYYQIGTGKFACLGHDMLENDFEVKNGSLYSASIENIKKSKTYQVGQKIGNIDDEKIGIIEKNNNFGVYGKINQIPNKNIYKTASIDEIKLGDAYFLTVLNGNNIEKCNIKITNLSNQNEPQEKGIKFIITDQNIINQCNGIIQGMSGSPIIQNNKLIGCVTHASKSNTLEGFGMYIQWMIDNE